MPITESSILDVVRADMDKALKEMTREYYTRFFYASPQVAALFKASYPAPPWPIRRWATRAGYYLRNIWDAVRGIEHDCGCDDW